MSLSPINNASAPLPSVSNNERAAEPELSSLTGEELAVSSLNYLQRELKPLSDSATWLNNIEDDCSKVKRLCTTLIAGDPTQVSEQTFKGIDLALCALKKRVKKLPPGQNSHKIKSVSVQLNELHHEIQSVATWSKYLQHSKNLQDHLSRLNEEVESFKNGECPDFTLPHYTVLAQECLNLLRLYRASKDLPLPFRQKMLDDLNENIAVVCKASKSYSAELQKYLGELSKSAKEAYKAKQKEVVNGGLPLNELVDSYRDLEEKLGVVHFLEDSLMETGEALHHIFKQFKADKLPAEQSQGYLSSAAGVLAGMLKTPSPAEQLAASEDKFAHAMHQVVDGIAINRTNTSKLLSETAVFTSTIKEGKDAFFQQLQQLDSQGTHLDEFNHVEDPSQRRATTNDHIKHHWKELAIGNTRTPRSDDKAVVKATEQRRTHQVTYGEKIKQGIAARKIEKINCVALILGLLQLFGGVVATEQHNSMMTSSESLSPPTLFAANATTSYTAQNAHSVCALQQFPMDWVTMETQQVCNGVFPGQMLEQTSVENATVVASSSGPTKPLVEILESMSSYEVNVLNDFGLDINAIDQWKDILRKRPIDLSHPDSKILLARSIADIVKADSGYKFLFELKDSLGRGVVHWAAASESTDILEDLIEMGADINVPDDRDQTPLFIAVNMDAPDALKLLLKAGANPDQLDYDLRSVVGYARHFEIFKILKEAGASFSIGSWENRLGKLKCLKFAHSASHLNKLDRLRDVNSCVNYFGQDIFTYKYLMLRYLTHSWEVGGSSMIDRAKFSHEGLEPDEARAYMAITLNQFCEAHPHVFPEKLREMIDNTLQMSPFTTLALRIKLMQDFNAGKSMIIDTGFRGYRFGHAVNLVIQKGVENQESLLLICNKGAGSLRPIEAYAIDPNQVDEEFFDKVQQHKHRNFEQFNSAKNDWLRRLNARSTVESRWLERLPHATRVQKVGNCGWESLETAIYGMMGLHYIREGLVIKDTVYDQLDQWQIYDQFDKWQQFTKVDALSNYVQQRSEDLNTFTIEEHQSYTELVRSIMVKAVKEQLLSSEYVTPFRQLVGRVKKLAEFHNLDVQGMEMALAYYDEFHQKKDETIRDVAHRVSFIFIGIVLFIGLVETIPSFSTQSPPSIQ